MTWKSSQCSCCVDFLNNLQDLRKRLRELSLLSNKKNPQILLYIKSQRSVKHLIFDDLFVTHVDWVSKNAALKPWMGHMVTYSCGCILIWAVKALTDWERAEFGHDFLQHELGIWGGVEIVDWYPLEEGFLRAQMIFIMVNELIARQEFI